MPGKKRFCKQA